ncbi:hypothetical protein F511_41597 [Dorcoceras hygrometricum]|uniref:Uncharacterized protein n=1 Tax=Dorcoceras hygrometricum TaxID=472368 RepID=A0A2Z7B608_9LAMI|nr:hypothetical protein F511_41597 [Dorcoceras hygrometricum]
MSSPDYDLVVRSAESIDHSSTPEASNREDENPSLIDNYRARILRIDQDEARLTTQGCTWYDIKASTLRHSDISYVKDKAGITSLYEVLIPHIHARAHRPPAGFHTFYINQIDRGLRFPLPTFIESLCHYIGVSPSQLAPNSYSSLLSLGILLKFHGIPLSTYVLMQLVTIKRLVLGIRIRPPARQRKNNKYSRETINTKNRIQNSTFIGRSKRIPCWHLCLAPTGITRSRLFSVDCGR